MLLKKGAGEPPMREGGRTCERTACAVDIRISVDALGGGALQAIARCGIVCICERQRGWCDGERGTRGRATHGTGGGAEETRGHKRHTILPSDGRGADVKCIEWHEDGKGHRLEAGTDAGGEAGGAFRCAERLQRQAGREAWAATGKCETISRPGECSKDGRDMGLVRRKGRHVQTLGAGATEV